MEISVKKVGYPLFARFFFYINNNLARMTTMAEGGISLAKFFVPFLQPLSLIRGYSQIMQIFDPYAIRELYYAIRSVIRSFSIHAES